MRAENAHARGGDVHGVPAIVRETWSVIVGIGRHDGNNVRQGPGGGVDRQGVVVRPLVSGGGHEQHVHEPGKQDAGEEEVAGHSDVPTRVDDLGTVRDGPHNRLSGACCVERIPWVVELHRQQSNSDRPGRAAHHGGVIGDRGDGAGQEGSVSVLVFDHVVEHGPDDAPAGRVHETNQVGMMRRDPGVDHRYDDRHPGTWSTVPTRLRVDLIEIPLWPVEGPRVLIERVVWRRGLAHHGVRFNGYTVFRLHLIDDFPWWYDLELQEAEQHFTLLVLDFPVRDELR